MNKNKLLEIGIIIWIILFSVGAFSAYKRYHAATQSVAASETKLNLATHKSVKLINETGNGTVYLAPKGQTESKDGNADVLNKILQKTFIYKSPNAFKAQIGFVRPRVTGEFYDYWLHGGIERNYELMKSTADGRSYRRFAKEITLTKFDNKHYFAIVKTGVSMSGSNENDIQPDLFLLNITRQNGKWNFARVPGVNSKSEENIF